MHGLIFARLPHTARIWVGYILDIAGLAGDAYSHLVSELNFQQVENRLRVVSLDHRIIPFNHSSAICAELPN